METGGLEIRFGDQGRGRKLGDVLIPLIQLRDKLGFCGAFTRREQLVDTPGRIRIGARPIGEVSGADESSFLRAGSHIGILLVARSGKCNHVHWLTLPQRDQHWT